MLGVAFEWPVGSERHYPEAARAICDAALLADDPRLINGASVVVLETAGAVESACLSSGVVACWHPDYDDEAGAGTIYIGPPRDGEPFSDAALKHELGHLIRWRAQHDADGEHRDADWWALYDAEILVCVEPL